MFVKEDEGPPLTEANLRICFNLSAEEPGSKGLMGRNEITNRVLRDLIQSLSIRSFIAFFDFENKVDGSGF
ncbi:hypothetical protein D3C72_2107240 [compost metagenome]